MPRMNQKINLLLILILAFISSSNSQQLLGKPPEESKFDKYADWSVNGVRPGMSLPQAKSVLPTLGLETAVDYFGKRESLYRQQGIDSYSAGYIVVDEQNTVIQVQGGTLQRYGKTLSELPFAKDAESTFVENRCRATDLISHLHKIQFTDYPVALRGPVMPQVILGDDPEWLAFCYRTDDLGVCLEGLNHVGSLIPDARKRLKRYATTIDDLPYYRADKGLIHVLTCPLGGTYQLNGPTLTCYSHPDGPISVTVTDKNIKFWRGAPNL